MLFVTRGPIRPKTPRQSKPVLRKAEACRRPASKCSAAALQSAAGKVCTYANAMIPRHLPNGLNNGLILCPWKSIRHWTMPASPNC